MKYILMAALYIFIVYIGYRFAEQIAVHRLCPGNTAGAMERIDCILLAVLTLVYGCTAFVNLGSTKVPETFYHFEPGASVTLDLGEVKDVSHIAIYTGLNTGSYDLWGSADGNDYEKYETIEQNYAQLFDWNESSKETVHTLCPLTKLRTCFNTLMTYI